MLKHLLAALTLIGCHSATAQTTIEEIRSLMDEMHYTLDRTNPTPQTLDLVAQNLRANIDLLRGGGGSPLICIKSGNQLYYPAKRENGTIVGDSSYGAGHSDLAGCRKTLPGPFADLTCFKRTNQLYYPTNPRTGEIVGSSAYGAGYQGIDECLTSIQ